MWGFQGSGLSSATAVRDKGSVQDMYRCAGDSSPRVSLLKGYLKPSTNVGALIVRIGCWGKPYSNY